MQRGRTSSYQRAASARYYARHREERLAYQEQYRRSKGVPVKPPKMTDAERINRVVVCGVCGGPVTSVARRRVGHRLCGACVWKQNPPDPQENARKTAAAREARAAKRAWVKGVKAGQPCSRCGEIGVPLHFHHRDPATKAFTIARGLSSASWDRLRAEVVKCDLVCQPCHTALHPQ